MPPKIDPEFQSLIPPLAPEEYAALEQNLKIEGCRDALVTWRGLLLDGHNRLKLCQQHRIEFTCIEAPSSINNREEAQRWIISNQLARRNLTPEQMSYLRGKRYNLEKKTQGGNRKSNPQNEDLKTSERLAKELKVSKATIERDGQYAEAVDYLSEEVNQKAKDLLLSRHIKPPKDEVIRMAKAAKTDPQCKENMAALLDGHTPKKRAKPQAPPIDPARQALIAERQAMVDRYNAKAEREKPWATLNYVLDVVQRLPAPEVFFESGYTGLFHHFNTAWPAFMRWVNEFDRRFDDARREHLSKNRKEAVRIGAGDQHSDAGPRAGRKL